METQPCPLVYILSVAHLEVEMQSWIDATETLGAKKQKAITLVLYRKSLPTPAINHHLSFLLFLKWKNTSNSYAQADLKC